MRPPCTPHKRKSSSIQPRKRRSPKRKGAKKKRRAKKKPAKKKPSKRSSAASKGWETRRKKKRLLEAMADLRMKAQDPNAQPPGWTERRAGLREIDDGGLWEQIIVTYDKSKADRHRLAILKELEIDMLNRFDLHDYLEWLGDETDTDLSDMYQMYLGYSMDSD